MARHAKRQIDPRQMELLPRQESMLGPGDEPPAWLEAASAEQRDHWLHGRHPTGRERGIEGTCADCDRCAVVQALPVLRPGARGILVAERAVCSLDVRTSRGLQPVDRVLALDSLSGDWPGCDRWEPAGDLVEVFRARLEVVKDVGEVPAWSVGQRPRAPDE